jgi:hypothetical protein
VTGILAIATMAGVAAAQDAPKKKAPLSPPAEAEAKIGASSITIKYSAPSVRGRVIFGADGILKKDPTYPVWRAGANNATSLATTGDLTIGGLAVPKGEYTLYVLPDAAGWKLIINKQTAQWGTNYKEAEDLGRVPMKMSKPTALVETLKYTLASTGGNKGTLTLEWENVSASVDIAAK